MDWTLDSGDVRKLTLGAVSIFLLNSALKNHVAFERVNATVQCFFLRTYVVHVMNYLFRTKLPPPRVDQIRETIHRNVRALIRL